MAKMSKAERKALKAKQHAENTARDNKRKEMPERSLGYDADFYVDSDGNEVECVRIDFVKKPAWYEDMFRAGDIHYRNNELQAKCSDGQWHAEPDVKCALAKTADGRIVLIGDKELKEAWTLVATSSSGICIKRACA